MASIQKMNETIYSYLFGEEQGNNSNFHEDFNLLMKAIEKAMGAGKETKWGGMGESFFWFAVYPEREILNKREHSSKWIVKVGLYSCAFTKYGMGRMEHGQKFNHEFQKSSPILAMHYSLYRLIKNGLEY